MDEPKKLKLTIEYDGTSFHGWEASREVRSVKGTLVDLLAVELIGIVPEDETVIIGSNRGAPVAFDPKSKAGQAFRNIAKRLRGEKIPFMDLDHTEGLWQRLQRLAGRK